LDTPAGIQNDLDPPRRKADGFAPSPEFLELLADAVGLLRLALLLGGLSLFLLFGQGLVFPEQLHQPAGVTKMKLII
jgi:hypothetical protein